MTQNTTKTQPVAQQPSSKKPNDTGSISVEGFVRIFDPSTKEVFVEKRA
jgi:hypothetical protein